MEQKIKTIEMTRRIRETNYERLRGLSREQRLAYYREKAKQMNEKAIRLRKTKPHRVAPTS